MQKFVRNVIDAESPENARYYFVENFRNHDPAPLEDDEPATDRDEANKALARRFFYDVWSNGKLELIDELFAPEFTNGLPLPGQRPGVAGVRQLVRRLRSAFPDGSVSVDLQLATENRVVSRYTFRGTHQGTFRGVPATGKTVEVTGIGIHAVGPGGRITGHWGYFDDMTLITQLGLLTLPSEPPPGGAPPPPGGNPPGGNPPPGTGYPQGQQAQQRPDVTQRITVQQPPGQQPPGQQPSGQQQGQYQPPQQQLPGQQPPGQQPPGGQQSSW
ncbi:ester cyclase [Saccharopolyspora shandongensis]|uniref:ester cyclase n=1 Tax=Saccharopolyspora shandongensis TaxID=418495 RepID=UPI0033E669DF